MPSGFVGSAVILGVRVVLESDLEVALKAALDAFPNCDGDTTIFSATPVYIVLTGDHRTDTPTRENRVRGTQLHIADDGITALADGERGRASCSFRIDVIGGELFRETVITAALFMATRRGRVPVHASAVMVGECACVMAGRSGSGKSTLALAANRYGLPVLAEDTVFVQRAPAFKIWGAADHIHVYEKDMPAGAEARMRLRSGRIKRALPIGYARHSADRAVLCVIARGSCVQLDPLPVEDAVRTLTQKPEPGYNLFADHLEDAIRAIAVGGCWRLTLSHDPDAAMAAVVHAFTAGTVRRPG